MPDLDWRSALMKMFNQDWLDKLRIYCFHLRAFVWCTTPRKLLNVALIKVQHWLRRDRVIGMPAKYFIDPINVCNLRCPLCPTGRGVLARSRGRMTLADLKQIVHEIAPYAYRVELYNWGEPLLHPDIFDMIKYISQQRIMVGLSSNLNILDANKAQQLVDSGLAQLVVSIDGATQESYAAYRHQGKLDDVLSNLQLLLETRRALKRRTPFVIWRMLVGKHNEHEVEAVRRMAHEMGVDSFSTGMLYVDTLDPNQIEQWVPINPAYNPYYNLAGEKLKNTWDCHDLWESMVINWDGGVAPCCWLHDPQFDFGNVFDRTVREVWNGSHYVSARRIVGKHGRQLGDVTTICHRCRGHPHYMAY